jgi:hypothetical protein
MVHRQVSLTFTHNPVRSNTRSHSSAMSAAPADPGCMTSRYIQSVSGWSLRRIPFHQRPLGLRQPLQAAAVIAPVILFPDQLVVLVEVRPGQPAIHRNGCDDHHRKVLLQQGLDLLLQVLDMAPDELIQILRQQRIGLPVEESWAAEQVVEPPPERDRIRMEGKDARFQILESPLGALPPVVSGDEAVPRI